MPVQIVPIEDLGGGVNDHNRPDKIAPSEITNLSRNVRGDAEFCVQRNGYITIGDELAGSTGGMSLLTPYLRNAAANDRLISVYNNKIYSFIPGTSSTWTEITQSYLTSGVNINATYYYDWLFFMNGVDKPVRVEGTTVTQPFVQPDSMTAATFLPAFGAVYQGSLFVAGVPTRPNIVFISKSSTSATETNIYDFSGTLAGAAADANEFAVASRVTAIRKFDSALVVFTIDGAEYIPGLKQFGDVVLFDHQPMGGIYGAVSQKTTCEVDKDIFYLSPEKQIRSVRRDVANAQGFDAPPLSVKIQRFLDEEIDDDLSTAFSYFNSKERKYYLSLRKKGDTINTVRVIADMDRVDQEGVPSWYIDSNVPFGAGCVYQGMNYTGNAVLGQAYQDGVGLADDDDANIEVLRVSKDYNANNPLAFKKFKVVNVFGEMTQSTTFQINVYVDDVLASTKVVSSADIANADILAGIGTDSTGDFEVGDESEDDTPLTQDYYEFSKRMRFSSRGKKLRVDIVADGTNNSFRIRHMEYGFLPLSRFQHPVSEL